MTTIILAGDIGGTKTELAIFEATSIKPIFESRYLNREQESLTSLVHSFINTAGIKITHACFAVAGPVRNNQCTMPNLGWTIDGTELQHSLGLTKLALINDLEATAHGIPRLPAEQFAEIHKGVENSQGNAALLAAGTGLGEAIMLRTKDGYHISATEGGHTDFAPQNKEEIGLLQFLAEKYNGHVSVGAG